MGCSPINNNKLPIMPISSLSLISNNQNINTQLITPSQTKNEPTAPQLTKFPITPQIKAHNPFIDTDSSENDTEYDLLLGKEINSLSIKTEIFLSCKNLPKLTSTVNSFIKAFRNEGNEWIDIGQTEVYKNSVNPTFIKSFIMNYHFEEEKSSQKLKFQINFKEKDNIIFIGEICVTLKDILSSKNQELNEYLTNKKTKLIIRGMQKNTTSKYIQFKLGIRGKKFTKQKICCRISKKGNNDYLFPIYCTEEREQLTSKKENEFYWDTVQFQLDRLENFGILSKIEDSNIISFKIYELTKKDERPKLITNVDISSDDLKNKKEFKLKQISRDFHFLIIDEFNIIEKFTLFSFLVSEMEYKCYFFLDLTRSKFNCEISQLYNNKFTSLLHEKEILGKENNDVIYRPDRDIKCTDKGRYDKLNIIKQAMVNRNIKDEGLKNEAFKEIYDNNNFSNIRKGRKFGIQRPSKQNLPKSSLIEMNELMRSLVRDQFELDTESKCPVFGYGCNIPPDYDLICNCLSMTSDIIKPELSSYDKILEVYKDAMGKFYLSGPGLISDTLSHFFNYVKAEKFDDKKQKYNVGFYIVSNNIHDSPMMFNELRKYHYLPCSIIIVSIGNEFDSIGFQLKIDEFIKENNIKGIRSNMVYLNFNDIIQSFYGSDKYNEKVKQMCRYVYNRINEHFVKFIEMNNIKPFDYENICKRNTPNFIAFRNAKRNERYQIQKFLLNEKEKMICDIKSLKYSDFVIESAFQGKYRTFDRHFIISQLNKMKCKNADFDQPNRKFKGRMKYNRDLEFIMFEDQIYIDERKLLVKNKEKDILNGENGERKDAINKKICNICKVNEIKVIFQYCKHRYCCLYCIGKIKEQKCPICGKEIELFVQLYN